MSEEETFTTTFRVRYSETDAMGIVYHSNYIIWFEVGRGDYMRRKGWDYAQFEAQGYYLPVSEVDARFIASAHYGEMVTVRTRLVELRSRKVAFEYEVVNDKGELLARGHTKHICTDKAGRVRTIPRAVAEMLRGEARGE